MLERQDRLPTEAMRSAGLTPLVVLLSAAILCAYFGFTADDAYIYLRYAENFVDLGALVFNANERVSSMTAPVVALIDALLYAATGRALVAYKLLGVLCLAYCAWTVARGASGDGRLRAALLVIVLLSPCVLLWTVGGMETPLLMALITAITALALRADVERPSVLAAVGLLSGLAFVTRFDSVCFTAPVALHLLTRAKSAGRRLAFVLCGAPLPLAWLASAFHWYGDVLPTSYYVKTPSFARDVLSTNALYIAQYLVFVGLVPLALFLFVGGSRGAPRAARAGHVRTAWGPWAGIALMLGYGLSSATTHMMFGFRYFVPYVPAAALLVARVLLATNAGVLRTRAFAVFLWLFVAFQLVHARYTYAHSLNGLSLNGELRQTSVADIRKILPESARLGELIREHWESLGGPLDVHPRIHTFAEGIIPYTYREAYVLGTLVSYRHRCHPDLEAAAHYTVLLVPCAGDALDTAIQEDELGTTYLSTGAFSFQGKSWMLTARYRANPAACVLPPRIGGECLEASSH